MTINVRWIISISFVLLFLKVKSQVVEANQVYNIKDTICETISVVSKHFPELEHTRYKIRPSRLKTTLTCKPSILSLLLNKRENRIYIIKYNTRQDRGTIHFTDVPSDARTGLLAHEICHVDDYSKRSIIGIISRLFDYASKKRRVFFEKHIDSLTVKRFWERTLPMVIFCFVPFGRKR